MYIVRKIEEKDFEDVAKYEVEISKISFREEAITDIEFHKKKILTSYQKDNNGMMVLADEADQVKGWLWMDKKTNFLTKEVYMSFRSVYVDSSIRGMEYVDLLMKEGMNYAKKCNAKNVVGKVHVDNLAMRTVYKIHGFKPTHITMEIDL